jgi:hypothetical protein
LSVASVEHERHPEESQEKSGGAKLLTQDSRGRKDGVSSAARLTGRGRRVSREREAVDRASGNYEIGDEPHNGSGRSQRSAPNESWRADLPEPVEASENPGFWTHQSGEEEKDQRLICPVGPEEEADSGAHDEGCEQNIEVGQGAEDQQAVAGQEQDCSS